MKKLLFLLLAVSGVSFGANSYTSRIGIPKPADHDLDWGTQMRAAFDIIDSSMATQAGTNRFTGDTAFQVDSAFFESHGLFFYATDDIGNAQIRNPSSTENKLSIQSYGGAAINSDPGGAAALEIYPAINMTPTLGAVGSYGSFAVTGSSANASTTYSGFIGTSSIDQSVLWSLPKKDASGIWQSDGSGHLSIGPITSIADSGSTIDILSISNGFSGPGAIRFTTPTSIYSTYIDGPSIYLSGPPDSGLGSRTEGFTFPAAGIAANLLWSLPVSDQSGFWKSDGAQNLSVYNLFATTQTWTAFQAFTSSMTVSQANTGSVNAVVFTSTGTGSVLKVIGQGSPGGGVQQRVGYLTIGDQVNTKPIAAELVLVSSRTDAQVGAGHIELWADGLNDNDPMYWEHRVSNNSAPDIRIDAPAPNMEVVATSTANAVGRGKWEPWAVPSASEIMQVNSRCWDNTSFENVAYWEPLNIQSSVGKPGLYMKASDSTGCDSGVVTSSNTAGVNFFTLNNHTVGITGPQNVTSGSWRIRISSTIPVAGQTYMTQGADSLGDYPMVLGTTQSMSQTKAQIAAIIPGGLGQQYYCSDCTTTINCISTGTVTAGAFSAQQAANRTTACQ